jgi:hypothetical protein
VTVPPTWREQPAATRVSARIRREPNRLMVAGKDRRWGRKIKQDGR